MYNRANISWIFYVPEADVGHRMGYQGRLELVIQPKKDLWLKSG